MTNLEASWTQTWSDLGFQTPAGLYDKLISAYSEPQRHYHTLQHLSECLAHFEQVRQFASNPGEVELALWFHDAIYQVQGKDNEQQSANWAVSVLREVNAAKAAQERVSSLILATKHEAIASDSDQQLLVDIDLAILGAAPERFAEYDQQVRAEYSWVPNFLYNMKRKAVMKSFLSRDYIYGTKSFRERYEDQARINLAAFA